MDIEIKKSIKPVYYKTAINILEKRVHNLALKNGRELIWFLEHKSIFTAGTSYKENDIIEKSIKIFKTNRGGKITWHGPGQIICYLVIDLNKRKKDIRRFISAIEKSIINTLEELDMKSFNDRKNIGIWINHNNQIKKIAAIGIRVKKWIAFHGFSINYSNSLEEYKKIVPCGIRDKGIINIINIKKVNKEKILNKLKKNLLINLDY
ncbi:lipoyl(octanoyl) transferase LipB [Candidatus Pelagibacter communis]|uniref:lipoyl(octanoyl) transferase LipB n=1 Tax=Pelagibacter ubique TaxID=198252 RepID=UPI00094CB131|nr:lipoyl(octanoyl) transferase LipB [Candidatus Pelagibacter ubique]